ncbi:MAG: DUF1929 domain-containing protein [Oligoflexus sp.]|nr:DUF1929 domain-containing protein [Oligoflexus sp.]
MKYIIIPILLASLPAGCKSLKAGYNTDPSGPIGSGDQIVEKVEVKNDGSGSAATTPITPPIPTAPLPGPEKGPVTETGPAPGTETNAGTDNTVISPSDPAPSNTPLVFPSPPDPMSISGGNGTNVLLKNQELQQGQSLASSDGRFTLTFQADGNLVLYLRGRALWASGTNGKGGVRASFQADGNLVVYDNGNGALWASGTNNQNATLVKLTNDGSVGVYKTDSTPLWTSGTCCYPPAAPVDTRPIAVGKWGPKMNWPVIPIHSVLLPSGKVLSYGTDDKGVQGAELYFDLWTPTLNSNAHQSLPNSLATDVFCGSPIVIPMSGDVLMPGGDAREPPFTNYGIKDTLLLKRDSQSLVRGPYLANGRWYATSTILPNGDSLIYGGIDGAHAIVTVPEVYSPKDNTWRTVTGAASGDVMNGAESKWFYPRNFVAPDGRVFGMSGEKMYYINPNANGSIENVGQLPSNSRSYVSSAVMYEGGKILQVGGSINGDIGSRASDQAIQVNINSGKPVVSRLNPMAFDRTWVSATILPSAEVLITGGSAFENKLQDTALTAELWSPVTESFRPLSSSPIARLYHSTSLLLPDATVLIGGGGAPGPLTNLNAEIFYPPYLFKADGSLATRPSIVRATGHEDYGHTSNMGVDGTISKVAMIKTGAVTHSFDFEQRFISLSFNRQGNSINVKMPANSNLATPGFYHIFAIDPQGVPSLSRIVSLGVDRDRGALLSGDSLSQGDTLKSADGRSILTFGADGNLGLAFQGNPIWSSNTAAKGGVAATMQADGNFVISSATGAELWSTHTQNNEGVLRLQNDANLVLYKGNAPYWASGTIH